MMLAAGAPLIGTASRRQQVDLDRTAVRDEANARNRPPEFDYDDEV
jgi:hypothetical protein